MYVIHLALCPLSDTNPTLSFIPESPRYLISKDRHEEAFKVIVKYHAEGDENSEFAKAEMAEIKTTIAIELEHAKRSWMDMVSTPGNRRRLLIGSLVGVMTQLSGNVVISYYLGDILKLVGFTDPQFAAKYNIGNQVWGLLCAVVTALIVMRFRRRTMYLFAIAWILVAYVGWTISAAVAIEKKNDAAAKLTLFWIYFYQPGYNIGFNALTYSKRGLWDCTVYLCRRSLTCYRSVPGRALPLRDESTWYHRLPVLRESRAGKSNIVLSDFHGNHTTPHYMTSLDTC